MAPAKISFGFVSRAYWMDLGTPEAYLQAHVDLIEGKVTGHPAYPAPFVAYAANALLLAVIPLLLLGAFLLDTLEDDVARRRAARQDDDDNRPGLRLVLPPASD